MKSMYEYRIVTNGPEHYDVEYKPFWWPWWTSCGRMSTFKTVESAIQWVMSHNSPHEPQQVVVAYLGRLGYSKDQA